MSVGLLFDTHTVIWSRLEPARLTKTEREAITAAHRRFVSIVSLWEFGTLMSSRRIAVDPKLFDLPDGCELLTVAPDHCRTLIHLPRHHGDPFDRMLIAQARSEGLGILTRDRAMTLYGRRRDGLLIPD